MGCEVTPLVATAAATATPVFPDRDATVEKVVELTAKAATKDAALPVANVNSSPVSARRSTTGPVGNPALLGACPCEIALFRLGCRPERHSQHIPGGERRLQQRSTPTVDKGPRFR